MYRLGHNTHSFNHSLATEKTRLCVSYGFVELLKPVNQQMYYSCWLHNKPNYAMRMCLHVEHVRLKKELTVVYSHLSREI